MTNIDPATMPRETLKPEPSQAKSETKADVVNRLLRRAKGATITDIMSATGWQPLSVVR